MNKSCSQTSAIIFTFTEKQPARNNQHISSFKQLFQESALKVGYMKNLEQIINYVMLEQIINIVMLQQIIS